MRALSFLSVLAFAIALTVMLANTSNGNKSMTTSQAVNGPFRDGLYLGTRAARRGEAPHVASGRWAQSQDRQSFAAGYRQAYPDPDGARSKKVKGVPEASPVR
jgi:hypothetical protein